MLCIFSRHQDFRILLMFMLFCIDEIIIFNDEEGISVALKI